MADKRVLISIDEGLLRRIDRAARDRGLSRSAYLAQLAEHELATVWGTGTSPSDRAPVRRLTAEAHARVISVRFDPGSGRSGPPSGLPAKARAAERILSAPDMPVPEPAGLRRELEELRDGD